MPIWWQRVQAPGGVSAHERFAVRREGVLWKLPVLVGSQSGLDRCGRVHSSGLDQIQHHLIGHFALHESVEPLDENGIDGVRLEVTQRGEGGLLFG